MGYIESETMLRRFSSYLRKDVREALDDDRGFVEAQLGSLSSSLFFLSREESGRVAAVAKQRDAFREQLSELEAVLAELESAPEDDGSAPNDAVAAVRAALESARDRVREPEQLLAASEVESTLIDATNELLEAIDTSLPDGPARRARKPLYNFLETRHTSQLVALGGDADR